VWEDPVNEDRDNYLREMDEVYADDTKFWASEFASDSAFVTGICWGLGYPREPDRSEFLSIGTMGEKYEGKDFVEMMQASNTESDDFGYTKNTF
jgi:hypothetical protein